MPSLDPDMSRIVEYELERFGVVLRLGGRVVALGGHHGKISGLKARGGLGTAPADAVLLDTGVVPAVSLAEAAGIRVGLLGGIQVNEYMETSAPGVFAAGNCVESYCRLRNRPILHHIGTVAAKQGRVGGENLAGRRATFAGTLGTTILMVFELGVARTGLTDDDARAERIPVVSARIEALDRAGYIPAAGKVWIKMLADRESKKIIGVQAVGYGDVARPIDVAATAITGSLRIDDILQLDLSYSPPYGGLWAPLLIAAQAVARKF
jgi:NADPH-dependent 2,4-dienoyl-CoA reductase/sulfur reductase-like enzyme